MNRKTAAMLLVAIFCSSMLQAQDSERNQGAMHYTGQEVIVSATRTLNTISDAGGSSVTVITAEEIRDSGQQSLEEVIRGVAGIDVVSTGGYGTNATVFMRGADSQNTLMLIDGIPANDPSSTNRTPNLSNLMVDDIERIEIVRGPVSVLYGSNAMAGVINIITRKGTDTPEGYAGSEGGSYGTWKIYGGARGKQGRLRYSLNAARLKTEGFSVADDRNSRIPHAGNTDEEDGYINTSLSANISYLFSKQVELEAVVRYADASVDLDDYLWAGYAGDREDADPTGRKDNHTDTGQLTGRFALNVDTSPLKSTFYYHFYDQKRDLYDNERSKTNVFSGSLDEVGWQGDLALNGEHTLTAGLNYLSERADNEGFGSWPSRLDVRTDMYSAFVQEQMRYRGLKLVAALRYDDHETFGGKTTWRIAPSCMVGATTFKASYGTGFRAPSLYELYSSYGNRELDPETSSGWDAGIEHRFTDRFRAGATYFSTRYEDRIDFDMARFIYMQTEGKTDSRGIESFVEWTPAEPFFVAASYTWTDASDPEGNPLARRPGHKAAVSGTWKVNGDARISTALQWVGERQETAFASDAIGNPVGKLDSYVLVNLSGSYRLTEQVELYGRIDNLFDEFYEEAWSYATPGRSAYAGVKLTF
jgi:vitamin B12 transporter